MRFPIEFGVLNLREQVHFGTGCISVFRSATLCLHDVGIQADPFEISISEEEFNALKASQGDRSVLPASSCLTTLGVKSFNYLDEGLDFETASVQQIMDLFSRHQKEIVKRENGNLIPNALYLPLDVYTLMQHRLVSTVFKDSTVLEQILRSNPWLKFVEPKAGLKGSMIFLAGPQETKEP